MPGGMVWLMIRSCAEQVTARTGTAGRVWPAVVSQAGTGVARVTGREGAWGTNASAAIAGRSVSRTVFWSSGEWEVSAKWARTTRRAVPVRHPASRVAHGIVRATGRTRTGRVRGPNEPG